VIVSAERRANVRRTGLAACSKSRLAS
jgi:hypothetical protein